MTRQKSNNLQKLSLILVVLALMVPAVFAQISVEKYAISYDFFSGAEMASPTVCSCSSAVDKVTIVNTGSFGAIFTVETNIPNYAQIPFSQVTLEPGQQATLDIILSAPCGTEKELDYDILIKNNLNREQVISRTLTFTKCQTLEASLFVDKEQILPCEPVNYTIEILNPASFAETYKVRPTNYEELFDADLYTVDIGPGQKGIIETELGLSCDIYGFQDIGFEVESVNNGIFTELSHSLEVLQDYEFEAEIPESIVACQSGLTEFPVEVMNNVRFENSYDISLLRAPAYVKLDTKNIVVAGEDKEIFNILVEPPEGLEGEFNFTVQLKSELGDQILEKNVSMKVNDCFNIFVEIEGQENPTFCSGDYEFKAKVRNDGQFEENVYLGLDSSGYGTLSDETVRLEPGEEEEITISLDVPRDLYSGEVVVTLIASLNERETLKYWTDSISPNLYNEYECNLGELDKYWIYVRYYGEEAYLGIENNGIEETTYELSLKDDPKLSFKYDKITLAPGEKEYATILVNFDGSEPKSQYYNVTLTSLENDVEYEYTFKLIQTADPVFEKAWDYFKASSTCKKFTLGLLIVLLAAIILFIVRWSIKGTTMKDLWQFRLILILIGVLIVLVAFVIYGMPVSYKPALNESSNLTIQWYENKVKTIDFDTLFSDPDNDILTYEVIGDEPDNITIEMSDFEFKLIPDEDWSGNRRIRFKATDSELESVISPRINLEVVDVPDLSFAEIHAWYCVYFNLIIIVLIIILLCFTPFNSRKKEDGKVKVTSIKKEKGYTYYVDKDGDVSRRRRKR